MLKATLHSADGEMSYDVSVVPFDGSTMFHHPQCLCESVAAPACGARIDLSVLKECHFNLTTFSNPPNHLAWIQSGLGFAFEIEMFDLI